MTKRSILIYMAAICAVAFIFRTVYPFNTVFGMGFVNYLEGDAYNLMYYAKAMAAMTVKDSLVFMVQNNLFFSWLVAALSNFGNIEFVGAWLPPVLAVAVVIVVYFIGKSLFDNPFIGILSALFVAVIPSEFLHRSLLGFADHHVLEVLLLALIMLGLIRAIQSGKWFTKWSVLAGISLLFYCLNYKPGIYTIGLILIPALVVFLIRKQFKVTAVVAIAALIGLAIYLPIGGYKQLLFLFPGQTDTAVITTGEIISNVAVAPSARTTSELMPLFAPYGKFNPIVVITNLHLFILTFLAAFPLIWKYRKDNRVLLLIVWTVVILALTLNSRRFMYYFTLNVAILSAFAVYELAMRIKGKSKLQNAFILAIPLLVFSFPLAKSISEIQPYAMTEEWHKALVWVKDQPGETVTAWTDFGHWIVYTADKQVNYLPGPGGDKLALAFLTPDNNQADQLLQSLGTDYLIVDKGTLTRKQFALETYAGIKASSQSLAYRLYNKKYVPGYLELAYESESLRIYRYKE